MSVDIVYLSYNRLAFTQFSFEHLLANTNWSLVSTLNIYDDGSTDGTREWLDENASRAPVEVLLRSERNHSPPATMNQFVRATDAALFAKIDSDVVVPPGWLDALVQVMDAYPHLELLGMEAGRTGRPPAGFDGVYSYELCSHIGGVGLMRTSAFTSRPQLGEHGRFGFDHWQVLQRPSRGWVKPDLQVCCLDMVPVEPWLSLSERYIAEGWQRAWPSYDPRVPYPWEWFTDEEVAA